MKQHSGSDKLEHKQIHLQPQTKYPRMLFVSIAVTFFLFLSLGYFLVNYGENNARGHIETELSLGLNSTSSLLSEVLSKPLMVARLIANNDVVRIAIQSQNGNQDMEKVHQLLERYKQTSGALRMAIMSDKGIIISADREIITSVGTDVSFRPYVRQSLSGKEGRYFAYGATDNTRGYYASVPIYNGTGKKTWVVMAKYELDEDIVNIDKYKHMYFVSPDGVILLSSNRNWLLKSMYPISRTRRGQLAHDRQFASYPLEELDLRWQEKDHEVTFENQTYSYREFPMTDDGWRLVMFTENAVIFYSQLLMAGISLFLFIISAGVIFIIFKQKQVTRVVTQYNVDLERTVSERTRKLDTSIQKLESEIAERIQAEEALRDSEEKYENLFASIRDVIIVADPDRTIINANENALQEKFGYDLDEIVGKKTEIIYADKSDFNQAGKEIYNRKVITPGKIMEMNFRRKDGSIFTGEMYAMKLLNREGRPIGNCGIIRDITNQKKMEEELQKSHKLEAIGILAGGIAHDFNNLLTAVLNNIYLAKKHSGSEQNVHERLTQAEKAIKTAVNLTSQLLTFSKGGAPVKKTISLAKIIMDSVGFSLSGSNVTSKIEIADSLWPVDVDEGQMIQVIQNIVVNADQAMPEGGALYITAENVHIKDDNDLPLPKGKYINIKVIDEGCGISEEDLQKVFDPYFTKKQKGSGLGLAVTYSIIRNHNGHIFAKSKPGAGTAFSIYLPASEHNIVEEEPLKEELVSGQGRILIMDDDEMVSNSIRLVLENLGYEVTLAINGYEAIDKYTRAIDESRPYDLLIMDLTVPGSMGGREAMKRIRDINPKVKAIVSSGYSGDPVMSDYKQYGFKDVLLKPYQAEKLSLLLHRILAENNN